MKNIVILCLLVVTPCLGMESPDMEDSKRHVLVDFIDSSTQSEFETKAADDKSKRKVDKFQIKIDETISYFSSSFEDQTTSSRKTDLAMNYPITKKRTSIILMGKK